MTALNQSLYDKPAAGLGGNNPTELPPADTAENQH
jgi:hypothetical protein